MYGAYKKGDKVYRTKLTSCFNMFNGKTNLSSIVFKPGIDCSELTDMSCMFDGCETLTSLDLTSFDSSKVTNISNMFGFCKNLGSIKVSRNKWVISSSCNITDMFYQCKVLSVTYVD